MKDVKLKSYLQESDKELSEAITFLTLKKLCKKAEKQQQGTYALFQNQIPFILLPSIF